MKQKTHEEIKNTKIGLLTPMEPTELRYEGSVVWWCKCDCGGYALRSRNKFSKRKKTHCGCKNRGLTTTARIFNFVIHQRHPFTVDDLPDDITSRLTMQQTLSRLVADGKLNRVSQGIYLYKGNNHD